MMRKGNGRQSSTALWPLRFTLLQLLVAKGVAIVESSLHMFIDRKKILGPDMDKRFRKEHRRW